MKRHTAAYCHAEAVRGSAFRNIIAAGFILFHRVRKADQTCFEIRPVRVERLSKATPGQLNVAFTGGPIPAEKKT